MKCDYCGRYMSLVDYGAEWGTDWVCSQQAKHIEDDPEHWSTPDDCGGCNAKLFQCSREVACCDDCTHGANWPVSAEDLTPVAIIPESADTGRDE